MTRGRWMWVPVVLLLGVVAACGGDDDSPDTGAREDVAVDEESGDGDSSITDFGPSAPELDPSEMPAQGDTRFVVEGETFEFAAVDSSESAYACSVSPNSITVEYQLRPGLLAVQATHDGEKWQGQLNIAPAGSERIYSSAVGLGGTFAVEGTQAVYEGDFTWRTNADPGGLEDAGTGTLLISC